MKGSTLIGIVLGIVAIFGAFFLEGGTPDALFLFPPMLIVIGGTLAAGLAGSSAEMMGRMPTLFKIAVSPKELDFHGTMKQIVNFAGVARRDGILAIEDRLKHVKHPYLKKLLELCVDGTEPAALEKMVHSEMEHITERHNANIGLFTKMGGYSPTMGIIGTVMGLIATLAAAGSDPDVLIRNIASAFIATLWGIFMANIVWLPIGDKLRTLHDEEMRLYAMMLEGILALQTGETPSVIQAKLLASFPLSEQNKIMAGRKFRISDDIESKPAQATLDFSNNNQQPQKQETKPVPKPAPAKAPEKK
jgi:chemotaxis protein MotA